MDSETKKVVRYAVLGVGGLIAVMMGLGTFYVVPEGHVAVVKHLGKAEYQTNPGLQFKLPLIQDTEVFEVRERKNVEKMAAATANQLPAKAVVSLNWTVNKTAAKALFIQYGGLEQFETRVLDPRMRSAAKAGIAKFRADEIIRERQKVVAEIQKEIVAVTEGLPITISNTQLEDVTLPEVYMTAILAKEQAREDAKREEHKLVKQKLEAQQKVQTAEAERDAKKAEADGRAYQVKTVAVSRAEAIALVNEQLTKSPLYIDYLKAKNWNGVLPTTMLGSGGNVLFSLSPTQQQK